MKVKVLYSEGNEIEFLVEGVDEKFLNALRRIIIAHVPTLAIEDVYVKENSSALWDEFLAHRLGLIPLRADPSVKEARFYLKAEGPKTVYAKDLITDTPVEIVYPDIPIVKLDEGQKVDLWAVAVWGKGIEHSKWSPGFAVFRRYVEVHGSKKKNKRLYEYAKEVYPEGIEEKKDKFIIKDALKREGVLQIAEEDGAEIKEFPNTYVFYLESWGQKDKEKIIEEALDIMEKMLKEFELKLFGII